ncbi:uncharacterized protein NEMAJ01_1595 [Nematocida major]|uniref:uncharacterized protein n=1 Tax=Nematocida major TaxID=1912982 RepID=UPI002007D807|nr:uncharacterized protein NEMAJ01_1595 [Nematocida major]KAH9386699.1 hypothetical protein NEMAJ01_1595 [Nematocida major]
MTNLKLCIDTYAYNNELNANRPNTSYAYAPMEFTILMFQILANYIKLRGDTTVLEEDRENVKRIARVLVYFKLRNTNYELGSELRNSLYRGASAKEAVLGRENESIFVDGMENIKIGQNKRNDIYPSLQRFAFHEKNLHVIRKIMYFAESNLIAQKKNMCPSRPSTHWETDMKRSGEKQKSCAVEEYLCEDSKHAHKVLFYTQIHRAAKWVLGMNLQTMFGSSKLTGFQDMTLKKEARFSPGRIADFPPSKEKQKESGFMLHSSTLLDDVGMRIQKLYNIKNYKHAETRTRTLEALACALEYRMHIEAAYAVLPIEHFKSFPSSLNLYLRHVIMCKYPPNTRKPAGSSCPGGVPFNNKTLEKLWKNMGKIDKKLAELMKTHNRVIAVVYSEMDKEMEKMGLPLADVKDAVFMFQETLPEDLLKNFNHIRSQKEVIPLLAIVQNSYATNSLKNHDIFCQRFPSSKNLTLSVKNGFGNFKTHRSEEHGRFYVDTPADKADMPTLYTYYSMLINNALESLGLQEEPDIFDRELMCDYYCAPPKETYEDVIIELPGGFRVNLLKSLTQAQLIKAKNILQVFTAKKPGVRG